MLKPSENPPGINVKAFERIDDAGSVQDYIHILYVFDGFAGIQRLKEAAIERCRPKPGLSVLDVGCGTGLETIRLARFVASSGTVLGIDASEKFLDEARRRAATLGLSTSIDKEMRSTFRFQRTPLILRGQSGCFRISPIRIRPSPSSFE